MKSSRQYPCRICRRTFWSERKLKSHECCLKESTKELKERLGRTGSKPQKVFHERGKPKRGTHTRVTLRVRKEVDRRSEERFGQGCPVCERCGNPHNLTKAHLDNASQYGAGGDPWNVANLCGTHGTGGCHEWADLTAEGMRWKQAKRKSLTLYYSEGEGKNHWVS